MRSRILLLLLPLISACTGGAPEIPPLGATSMTIAPGLYILRGIGPSAAYVVDTSEGLVLVDAGLESDASSIKSEMAKLGLDWMNVKAVLLTHAHADHTGGAEHVRGATGAVVYAGEGDAAVLRAGSSRDALATIFMPTYAPHPTTVDVALTGGESFTIGDARFEAISTPGHTPGSICYLMERNGRRVLFGGDVIMRVNGSESPRYDLPGKPLGIYAAYLAPRYRGDARAFLTSLNTLQAMPSPDVVLPGHPDAPPPQDPVMTRARWDAMLDEGIRDLETLISRLEADGPDFLDDQSRQLLPDLYYLGDFQGAAVYAFYSGSKLYLVDAPGGPGLARFVDERLERLGLDPEHPGPGPEQPAAVLLTSADPEATAGLPELIETTHAQVVVSSQGVAIIRTMIPPGSTVLPAEDLPEAGWFSVTPIPLQGRGIAPVAYVINLHGHTILFSGRIPIRINEATTTELIADVLKSDAGVQGYLDALDRLQETAPDLWLPLIPSNSQNANLYDDRWDLLIEDNRSGIEQSLGR